MKYAIIIALLFFISCSPKMMQSVSHTETSDTSVSYLPAEVTIPGSDNSFEVDLTTICKDFETENNSLRQELATAMTINLDEPNRHASVSIIPKHDYKATIICHEDEWHRKYDSLRVNTVVVNTVKDSVATTVYQCDSSFHSFTVKWFFGSIVVMALGAYLFIRSKA